MFPAILGKKIGMTQIFQESGECIPVTIVQAGPCVVTQVKSADGPDGYNAVQLGFEDVKPHRATLPEIGHAKKAQTSPKAFTREIRLDGACEAGVGDTVTVDVFKDGEVEWVDVTGVTRGQGFQGAMKRHGFGGQPASHGVERKHRSPGSINGGGTDLGGGRIKKGKRMGGHTGNRQATIQSQKLVDVDSEHHYLLVRGAIPGPKNGYVIVRKAVKK